MNNVSPTHNWDCLKLFLHCHKIPREALSILGGVCLVVFFFFLDAFFQVDSDVSLLFASCGSLACFDRWSRCRLQRRIINFVRSQKKKNTTQKLTETLDFPGVSWCFDNMIWGEQAAMWLMGEKKSKKGKVERPRKESEEDERWSSKYTLQRRWRRMKGDGDEGGVQTEEMGWVMEENLSWEKKREMRLILLGTVASRIQSWINMGRDKYRLQAHSHQNKYAQSSIIVFWHRGTTLWRAYPAQPNEFVPLRKRSKAKREGSRGGGGWKWGTVQSGL